VKAVVKRLEPEKGQRVIAISDIHGSLKVFEQLLKKIEFSKKDLLILVGDMLEKGPQSLDTLHYIMELTKTHQVYPLLGNCDMVLYSVTQPEENERLKAYLLGKRSTIHEMYERLGKTIDDTTDIVQLKKELSNHYLKELNWLKSLPHIITAGNYIFAHAGLKSEVMSENTMQDVIHNDAFLNCRHQFTNTIVVGHMPVVLYDSKISSCNPIFDRKKNIISIDGGNVIKMDGQLNALIINDVTTDQVSYESMDLLPQAVVLEARNPVPERTSINVRWSDGEVIPLKQKDEFTYCRHCSSGYELWILNEFLTKKDEKTWAEEGTDYVIPVNRGDVVSVVKKTSRGYLIKRDGVVGWYEGQLSELYRTADKRLQ